MNFSVQQIETVIKIKQIVCEQFGINESEFHPDLDFKEDLQGDSLDLVELVMEFEDNFDITIPDEVASATKTPRNIFEYLVDASYQPCPVQSPPPAIEEEFKEEF